MAKKPKAQAGAEDAAAPEKKPGGKKKLLLLAAALVLVGGGAGGWFALKKPDHGPVGEAARPVAFVDLAEMVVNLASEPNQERARFLKLKVALEVKDAKTAGEVQPLLPRVHDMFQIFVRELRAGDLEGSGAIHRLREELLRRVNLAVFPTRVEAVLFREVILQ